MAIFNSACKKVVFAQLALWLILSTNAAPINFDNGASTTSPMSDDKFDSVLKSNTNTNTSTSMSTSIITSTYTSINVGHTVGVSAVNGITANPSKNNSKNVDNVKRTKIARSTKVKLETAISIATATETQTAIKVVVVHPSIVGVNTATASVNQRKYQKERLLKAQQEQEQQQKQSTVSVPPTVPTLSETESISGAVREIFSSINTNDPTFQLTKVKFYNYVQPQDFIPSYSSIFTNPVVSPSIPPKNEISDETTTINSIDNVTDLGIVDKANSKVRDISDNSISTPVLLENLNPTTTTNLPHLNVRKMAPETFNTNDLLFRATKVEFKTDVPMEQFLDQSLRDKVQKLLATRANGDTRVLSSKVRDIANEKALPSLGIEILPNASPVDQRLVTIVEQPIPSQTVVVLSVPTVISPPVTLSTVQFGGPISIPVPNNNPALLSSLLDQVSKLDSNFGTISNSVQAGNLNTVGGGSGSTATVDITITTTMAGASTTFSETGVVGNEVNETTSAIPTMLTTSTIPFVSVVGGTSVSASNAASTIFKTETVIETVTVTSMLTSNTQSNAQGVPLESLIQSSFGSASGAVSASVTNIINTINLESAFPATLNTQFININGQSSQVTQAPTVSAPLSTEIPLGGNEVNTQETGGTTANESTSMSSVLFSTTPEAAEPSVAIPTASEVISPQEGTELVPNNSSESLTINTQQASEETSNFVTQSSEMSTEAALEPAIESAAESTENIAAETTLESTSNGEVSLESIDSVAEQLDTALDLLEVSAVETVDTTSERSLNVAMPYGASTLVATQTKVNYYLQQTLPILQVIQNPVTTVSKMVVSRELQMVTQPPVTKTETETKTKTRTVTSVSVSKELIYVPPSTTSTTVYLPTTKTTTNVRISRELIIPSTPTVYIEKVTTVTRVRVSRELIVPSTPTVYLEKTTTSNNTITSVATQTAILVTTVTTSASIPPQTATINVSIVVSEIRPSVTPILITTQRSLIAVNTPTATTMYVSKEEYESAGARFATISNTMITNVGQFTQRQLDIQTLTALQAQEILATRELKDRVDWYTSSSGSNSNSGSAKENSRGDGGGEQQNDIIPPVSTIDPKPISIDFFPNEPHSLKKRKLKVMVPDSTATSVDLDAYYKTKFKRVYSLSSY
ncbi:hypothetical protein AX774_g5589 [Zancudomyces culisetae]|uniref:Zonadhesin n=1 Tax=Zancudomyces culisetae TaxID=1213189 RepID=A0A1R1PIX6_ZANCU|nr:hypothetical protein AX774_g5589 [Zancudomyces culisetae]|eukprot:OMH80965.1 hypothetical protein AX774_g5589 [Zancudomyces culisetae]